MVIPTLLTYPLTVCSPAEAARCYAAGITQRENLVCIIKLVTITPGGGALHSRKPLVEDIISRRRQAKALQPTVLSLFPLATVKGNTNVYQTYNTYIPERTKTERKHGNWFIPDKYVNSTTTPSPSPPSLMRRSWLASRTRTRSPLGHWNKISA
jgi:hypothetical protein